MSDNLPWEHKWGFAEWLEFKPETTHRTWKTSIFWCGIGNVPNGDGHTRDEAARNSVKLFCEENNVPLPFRPLPNLRSVESCIRAITEAGGTIEFMNWQSRPGAVWVSGHNQARYFGKDNEPWTPEAVQQAARYVLGITEEAATDE